MMKRIVEGVAYNTDTSTWIARKSATRQDERGREVYEMTILFQTAKGAYFLHKTSSVVVHAQKNEKRQWDEIIPMTADEARAWMLSGDVEVIHDPFAEGIPEAEPEPEQGATIYLRVPTTLKQRVEAAAEQANLSGNAWVIKCLEVGLTNPLVHLGPLPERVRKILSTPVLLKKVNELEISVRTEYCFKNADIIYLGDLVQRTEAEMLRVPNFGRKSLNEIKEVLAQMGLHLGMQVPGWPPKNIEYLAKSFESDELAESVAEAAESVADA